MATLGSIEVPIYAKLDGEYLHIGEVSLDVHGDMSNGEVKLSTDLTGQYSPIQRPDHLLTETYRRY